MPIPLLLPILLISGTTVLGGLGLKKGKDGVDAMRQAKGVGKAAERRHKSHVKLVDNAREHLRGKVDAYAELQRAVVKESFGRLFDCLARMDQKTRAKALESLGDIQVTPEVLESFKIQYLEAGGTAKGIFTAVGTGAGAAGVTTGLVSAFGTASTGAAISGLSGAAANSALLAWLGGGSLAAGGGGMALGSVVLGGIVVGPALAVTGFVLASQGEKALTRARAYDAEVDKSIAKLDLLIEFCRQVESRVDEMTDLVSKLDERLLVQIDALNAIVDEFDTDREQHIRVFAKTMTLAKGVSDLVRIPILTDGGKLNDETESALKKLRPFVEVEQ